MYKKAVMGTLATWIFATIIILFIMALYLIGIVNIFTIGNVFSKEDIKIIRVDNNDFAKTKNLISLSEIIKEEIFNWADGENDDYQKICDFFNNNRFDFNDKFIYFEINNPETLLVPKIEDRRILLLEEDIVGKVFCRLSTKPFFIKSRVVSKVSFFSPKGNLVEVSYVKKK
ncbi:MAG: hypothetical protein QW727_02540 [Candidatus Pacearchaeota archaeon]